MRVSEESKRGRKSYVNGKKYENEVARFLNRKRGLTRVSKRYRVSGAELDLIMKMENDLFIVEAKDWDAKVPASVVKRLYSKIRKSGGYIRGGIIVSKKGLSEDAELEARRLGIEHYRYAGARKRRQPWFLQNV